MTKSFAASIASLPEPERETFLDGLSENAISAMPYLWSLWANTEHQLPPHDDWKIWVILGGRGAGKTRAGAEWIRSRAEGRTPASAGKARRICLLGETIEQVRGVMVEGESGILACSPPDRRPEFKPSLNRLIWPNGCEAGLFSAANPEALRGPQFDCAWSDELAKWKQCREAWDMLQFCLRLGSDPRQLVTTSPRDNAVLVELLERADVVQTTAGTAANRANLAPGFVEALEARYAGTSLGRQEIDGELVLSTEGALWSRDMIEAARVTAAPELDRIVVAVDPPVTSGAGSDECGIIAAGISMKGDRRDWQVFVLADWSVAGKSPRDWASLAAEAYDTFAADRLVAEVNQGGDLVETLMRQVAPAVAYRGVRARSGKRVRAEPVAALYEQGRVHHVGALPGLEDQMCRFTARSGDGIKSPDRLDALVWAVTDLVIDAPSQTSPRARLL